MSKPIQVGQIVYCIRGSGTLLKEGDEYEIVMIVKNAKCRRGVDSGLVVKNVYYSGVNTTNTVDPAPYAPAIVWDEDRFTWKDEKWAHGFPNQTANAEYLKELATTTPAKIIVQQ